MLEINCLVDLMKKLLGIVVLGLLFLSKAYANEKLVVCSYKNMDLRFYIDEKNSRIRPDGEFIDNNVYYTFKKKSNYLVWQHRFTNQNNGKKRVNFNYYYFKEKKLLLNTYPDKANLSKEDIVLSIQFEC